MTMPLTVTLPLSLAQKLHQQQHFNSNVTQRPPLHLAPSITHQPELLLLRWLFETLFMLVTRILEHPIAAGPVPDPSLFADNNAYQLFCQLHRSIIQLGHDTLHLMRARRLPQFIPGPPGSPGQYRIDPMAYH